MRSFAEEEINPLAFLMDQNNEFPKKAVKKLGKLSWMGIPYPKEYGGAGLDALSYAIAVEELARVDGGTETTALDKGDYYLLNGGKIFITNAPKADTYVVFAIITPDIGTRGISAFIVEKGFEFGDNYDKMGIRSSSTAELIFNDVKIPKENLLGK
nr:acyl-CoA dehydrogenase family protein [Blautia wexlerae]